MIVRVLFLLLSLIVLVNLFIMAACYIMNENLYQKYGKQMLIGFGCFVFAVAVIYVVLALVGLN